MVPGDDVRGRQVRARLLGRLPPVRPSGEEKVAFPDLVQELRAATRGGAVRFLLGITGPPGSGKSMLATALAASLRRSVGGPGAVALPMDGFHRLTAELAENGLLDRKGAPETFDSMAFADAVARVARRGPEDVLWPSYSRQTHDPVADAIRIPRECEVVIVEGNYLLSPEREWSRARGYFNAIWFVAADDSTIFPRLVARQLRSGTGSAGATRHVRESDLENARMVRGLERLADRTVRPSYSIDDIEDLVDPATGEAFTIRAPGTP